MSNAKKTGSLMSVPLANIEVIESHQAGVIGGTFNIVQGENFVAVYGYETACMTFTVVYLNGDWVGGWEGGYVGGWVCLDSQKVKIFLV